jgi:hypothetical protein
LELEKKLHKWIEDLQQEDILVQTNKLIAQTIHLDKTGQFKCSNAVSITRWVYLFSKDGISLFVKSPILDRYFQTIAEDKG